MTMGRRGPKSRGAEVRGRVSNQLMAGWTWVWGDWDREGLTIKPGGPRGPWMPLKPMSPGGPCGKQGCCLCLGDCWARTQQPPHPWPLETCQERPYLRGPRKNNKSPQIFSRYQLGAGWMALSPGPYFPNDPQLLSFRNQGLQELSDMGKAQSR
jgi:hypothetical protein